MLRRDAHRAQHDVALDRLLAFRGLHGHLAALAAGVHLGHFAAGHHLDALLLEALLQLLAHVLVLHGHHVRQELDQGDLRADGVVEIGELAADGTAADHHHALGLLGQHHGLAVADDLLAVLLQGGQFAAACTGGDDDVLAFHDLLLAVGAGHFDLLAGLQLAGAHDHVDLVLLHQELHAVAHALGHVAAALHDGLSCPAWRSPTVMP